MLGFDSPGGPRRPQAAGSTATMTDRDSTGTDAGTTRRVRVSDHGQGPLVHVEHAGRYAFARLDRDTVADVVLGDLPDTDGPVYAYIGHSFGVHYYDGKQRDEIPTAVYEELADHDATLLDDVDGGWQTWEGRPEWSETYIDVTDADPVDPVEIIDDRREEADA